MPAGFDTDGFLAAAKRNFVTLQDAWDRDRRVAAAAMMTDGMVARSARSWPSARSTRAACRTRPKS
jgi:mannose/cellobiose epimerase-like protein (N-acyl-D-glucosamine 2-epimerase family)